MLLRGSIEGELKYSNELYEKIFYKFIIASTKFTGGVDYVPIIISDDIVNKNGGKENLKQGKFIEVLGAFRSHSYLGTDKHKHTELFVFVSEMRFYNEQEEDEINIVYLNGTIQKRPYPRILAERSVSDFLLEVNREYYKKDHIPCIAWDWKARKVQKLLPGDKIKFYGRIKSRIYTTKEGTAKEAYEVSMIKIKKIEKHKN